MSPSPLRGRVGKGEQCIFGSGFTVPPFGVFSVRRIPGGLVSLGKWVMTRFYSGTHWMFCQASTGAGLCCRLKGPSRPEGRFSGGEFSHGSTGKTEIMKKMNLCSTGGRGT